MAAAYTVCKQLDVGRGRGVAKDDDSAWEVTSDSEIEVHTHTLIICTGAIMCVYIAAGHGCYG